MTNWDGRWLELAEHVGQWSKDNSTKVGCVIVGTSRQVLAIGYNGLPRGVNDNIPERKERPEKYRWSEHAERNAIYNAARTGTSVEFATLFVPFFPCSDCARAIVQSGIVSVVTYIHDPDSEFEKRWREDFEISWIIFSEADVQVIYMGRHLWMMKTFICCISMKRDVRLLTERVVLIPMMKLWNMYYHLVKS